MILRIVEIKRVENMPTEWYKITGRDKDGKEFKVDESLMNMRLFTGDYVEGEIREDTCFAEKIVSSFKED